MINKKDVNKKIDFRLEKYMFCDYLKWFVFLKNYYSIIRLKKNWKVTCDIRLNILIYIFILASWLNLRVILTNLLLFINTYNNSWFILLNTYIGLILQWKFILMIFFFKMIMFLGLITMPNNSSGFGLFFFQKSFSPFIA
jgi:hypothetical protein